MLEAYYEEVDGEMVARLRPCPFCGAAGPDLLSLPCGLAPRECVAVRCHGCGAYGPRIDVDHTASGQPVSPSGLARWIHESRLAVEQAIRRWNGIPVPTCPILFLDIDGVLNSKTFQEAGNMRDNSKQLDPACVKLLQHVLDTTRCGVVLSSAWRIAPGVDATKEAFERAGGRYIDFVGVTPSMGDKKDRRGHEIREWLRRNWYPPRFAILDDADDMGLVSYALTQTTWDRGLEQHHVERLIAQLGTPGENNAG
jgi:hypothetical protein